MIFTFYSYKGGVGRSMALANVAECLYQRGARVLMVDWDLEAPGLEHFFYPDDDAQIEKVRSHLGVIDMLLDYQRQCSLASLSGSKQAGKGEGGDTDRTKGGIFELVKPHLLPLESYLVPIHPPESKTDKRSRGLWLLPAGWRSTNRPRGDAEDLKYGTRDDKRDERFSKYAEAVQSFDWADLYSNLEGQAYFEWMRDQFRPLSPSFQSNDPTAGSQLGFDAVLIDSRTGVTEMGGVCTRQLADVVVSFCAPNYQNLDGVVRMTKSFLRKDIEEFRGGKKLVVVVVPSRVDLAGETTAQNRFRALFESQLKAPDLFQRLNLKMWDEMLIPYIVRYAYHEALAVGDPDANKTVADAYLRLASRLAIFTEKDSRLRDSFASELRLLTRLIPEAATEATSAVEEVVFQASSVLAGFTSEEKATARRIFTRLVRVTPEPSGDTRLRVKLNELKAVGGPVLSKLVAAGILKTQKDDPSQEETVELVHDVLLHQWQVLSEWLNQDREFLLWRLRLDAGISTWEQRKRDRDFLLRSKALAEARNWAAERPDDLSVLEHAFIGASGREGRRIKIAAATAVIAMASVVISVIGWWIWTYSNRYQIGQIVSDAPVAAAASSGRDGTAAAIEWVRALRTAGKPSHADASLQAALSGARAIQPIPADLSNSSSPAGASLVNPGPSTQSSQIADRHDSESAGPDQAPAAARSPLTNGRSAPSSENPQKLLALAMIAKELSSSASAREVLNEVRSRAANLSPASRAQVLSFIGSVYEIKGMPEDGSRSFKDAWAFANQIQGSNTRSSALQDIAADMAGSGAKDQAVVLVKSQLEVEPQISILISMASALARAGKQDDARQLLDDAGHSVARIKGSSSRYMLLFEIALVTLREKLDGTEQPFEQALNAARSSPRPDRYRAMLLLELARVLSSAGLNDEALKTYQEASQDSQSIGPDAMFGAVLLARAGRLADALAILSKNIVYVTPQELSVVVRAIVQASCTTGKCNEALQAARKLITDENSGVELSSVVPALVQANQIDAAKSVLEFVASEVPSMNDSNRANALVSLGQGWLKVGDQEKASAAFIEGAERATTIPNQNYKSATLAAAARGLASAHDFRRARLAAISCSAVDQLMAYTAILNAYSAYNK